MIVLLIVLAAASNEFILPNGRSCFTAKSGDIFCQDEKGVYRRMMELDLPDLSIPYQEKEGEKR